MISRLKSQALLIATACAALLVPAHSTEADAPLSTDDFNLQISPFSEDNRFVSKDWYNWGGSIIKGEDDLYHMFYSRWPKKFGFLSWLTHSEVAVATSKHPSGPWKYRHTALKGQRNESWDSVTAHNPKIKKFDGKYYLYYISTSADLNERELVQTAKVGYSHKNWKTLRNNQRTGVAQAKSLSGPWTRMNAPLFEPTKPLHTIVVNPAITQTPDGKYLLMVKGDKFPKPGSPRIQATAISDNPWGPFKIHPEPAVSDIDTEDASIWYDKNRERYYAVFHAHTYFGMITSTDGKKWNKAVNYKFAPKSFVQEDGKTFKGQRMERPFVFTTADGTAKVFLSSYKKGNATGILTIPLKQETASE